MTTWVDYLAARNVTAILTEAAAESLAVNGPPPGQQRITWPTPRVWLGWIATRLIGYVHTDGQLERVAEMLGRAGVAVG